MKNLEIGKNSWCCDIKGYCAAVLMFVGFLQHNNKKQHKDMDKDWVLLPLLMLMTLRYRCCYKNINFG